MSLAVTALFAVFSASTAPKPANPTVTGETLDTVPREVLLEILVAAEETDARVSSYERTAHKQAALMYGICERDGVPKAKRLYSKKSHSIIDVYADNRGKAEADVVALMTAEVKAVLKRLGSGRRTMMHVDSANYTFDIAPSSLRSRNAFRRALAKHPDVVRYFVPGGAERAFHIEVARTQRPITGTWTGSCDGGSEARLKLWFEGGGWIANLEQGAQSVRRTPATIDRKGKRLSVALQEPPDPDPATGSFADDYGALTLTVSGIRCEYKPLAAANASKAAAK